MNIIKYLKKFRGTLDTLLILLVLTLIGAILFVNQVNRGQSQKKQAKLAQSNPEEFQDTPPQIEMPKYQIGRKPISVAPVAYDRARVTQIARDMVVSESVQLPIRPALDMRARDETYEVRFALPQGTAAQDVNVQIAGNILTMVMQSENRAFMRRVRIPCDYAHNSKLVHFVSNQVLYVEISDKSSVQQEAALRGVKAHADTSEESDASDNELQPTVQNL